MPSPSASIPAEPLAVELHNTLYAGDGQIHDRLAAQASATAWLRALGRRLPEGPAGDVSAASLVALREAVRGALQAVAGEARPPQAAIDVLNEATGRAPSFVVARRARRGGGIERRVEWGSASRQDVVVAAFAQDAIDLITGPQRTAIRLCGAPGCVLLYVKAHPRQAWCSAGCGNRARQARHYQRTRARTAGDR